MQVGQKFEVETKFFVEILGFFPAGCELDRKAKYLATLNGYKMKVEADFLESLEKMKIEEPKPEEPKVEQVKQTVTKAVPKKAETKKQEVKQNGRRKRNA